jgi:hypothetical protein
MTLGAVGAETRTAVLLVLHDSAQPWATQEERIWKKPGRCP